METIELWKGYNPLRAGQQKLELIHRSDDIDEILGIYLRAKKSFLLQDIEDTTPFDYVIFRHLEDGSVISIH